MMPERAFAISSLFLESKRFEIYERMCEGIRSFEKDLKHHTLSTD